VIASYACGWDRITEKRITEIVLINKKNKPESIFSIQAVINEDVVIEVESFKPPLLLKPLESVLVKTTPFSALYVDNQRFHAEYHNAKTLIIYLITDNKKLKCKIASAASLHNHNYFTHYRTAQKHTQRFNDKVFNDRVKYAVIYVFDSQQCTAFIDDAGFITDDWHFYYNSIPKSHIGSKVQVREYLVSVCFDKFVNNFEVVDISKR
jgi:hypothetical protein